MENVQILTPRQLFGTCCLDDPECEHSFLEADELSRHMDTPIEPSEYECGYHDYGIVSAACECKD